MALYPTPHINATPSDFAKTVLMPGDPLRAKFIAENFLENAVLVNNVRGIQGYTGTYKGVPVSVMASGMGMPSIGIYSYELYNFFGVENIMRIGSTGSMNENVHVRDIVIGMGASYNSNYARQYNLPGTYSAIADYTMMKTAIENQQNLIVEGCYIPFNWQADFDGEYLKNIRYTCFVMSRRYIEDHFDDIRAYENVIEKRLCNFDLRKDEFIAENAYNLAQCLAHNLPYLLIDQAYEVK